MHVKQISPTGQFFSPHLTDAQSLSLLQECAWIVRETPINREHKQSKAKVYRSQSVLIPAVLITLPTSFRARGSILPPDKISIGISNFIMFCPSYRCVAFSPLQGTKLHMQMRYLRFSFENYMVAMSSGTPMQKGSSISPLPPVFFPTC